MSKQGPRPLTLQEKAALADRVGDYAALQGLNEALVTQGKAPAKDAAARNASFGSDSFILRVIGVLLALYLLGWAYALAQG